MNPNLHQFLSEVEALMSVSVIVCSFQGRLLHDCHDARVLFLNFFYVVAQSIALDIVIMPTLNFAHLLDTWL